MTTFWRELPSALRALRHLALDLRWTWSHEADALWARIDTSLWQRTYNPWTVLESVPQARLEALADDAGFLAHLDQLMAARQAYLANPGWFGETAASARLKGVAYFSMEFGLGEALPLYAGGLGILAGDFLKAASDLGMPVVGVGLLYQEGYFRQMIDASGMQHEAYPYNDPSSLPIEPMYTQQEGRLHIAVELPGRTVQLRVWRATVGRTRLYMLDSNDPVNGPADRGITGKLYGGGSEIRLMQEIVLGVGGWRLIEALHPDIEICHLNEGHAAFAVLERALAFARRHGTDFAEALWATRAGNVFTTHTPVPAGFDRFPLSLLIRYGQAWAGAWAGGNVPLAAIRQLGVEYEDSFNMAWLAARGSLLNFGVSRLHGAVSRRIFHSLYPRWPEMEVPFGHVTNGVHVPTWDSAVADAVWTEACGKERWRLETGEMAAQIETIADEALWAARGESRATLIGNVRRRLGAQLSGRGLPPEDVAVGETVLDPNVLSLGFARRFTAYKRPDLLLSEPDRLSAMLLNRARPVQLVMAGKAHPDDAGGKQMIQEWLRFAQDPRHRPRIVFLEDYDISLAQELVQGVDVWINTPRRPWEACGTSGMKVLVNGGLNLSTLDGWWEEAYAAGLGWAIGNGDSISEHAQDQRDATQLYELLERQVIPTFYDRDANGIPRAWVARMRRSMSRLTMQFGASRMVRDYLERAYLPAAQALRERTADGATTARAIAAWERRLQRAWPQAHLAEPAFTRNETGWAVSVLVYLGEIPAGDVQVELYADPLDGSQPEIVCLARDGLVTGAVGSYLYYGQIEQARPPQDYTVRLVPFYPGVRIPTELPVIYWQR